MSFLSCFETWASSLALCWLLPGGTVSICFSNFRLIPSVTCHSRDRCHLFWGTIPQTSSAWEKHGWNGEFLLEFPSFSHSFKLALQRDAPFPSTSPLILLGSVQCLLLGLMVYLPRFPCWNPILNTVEEVGPLWGGKILKTVSWNDISAPWERRPSESYRMPSTVWGLSREHMNQRFGSHQTLNLGLVSTVHSHPVYAILAQYHE